MKMITTRVLCTLTESSESHEELLAFHKLLLQLTLLPLLLLMLIHKLFFVLLTLSLILFF